MVSRWSNVLQPEPVVYGMSELLLAAKIAFGRLHRDVTQQKLDLLQLPSCNMTQARASPSQVMRREIKDSGALGSSLHHMPYRFG